eukprot:scaffold1638_cov258-Pinguiococcus_pyrenoidosus.AAC.75
MSRRFSSSSCRGPVVHGREDLSEGLWSRGHDVCCKGGARRGILIVLLCLLLSIGLSRSSAICLATLEQLFLESLAGGILCFCHSGLARFASLPDVRTPSSGDSPT